MTSRPVLLSAFTGAGGLDLGFEAAGFDVAGCIENDPTTRDTLVANRPRWPLVPPHDINAVVQCIPASLQGFEKGGLDILIGGPPCQPYSKAAQWTASGRVGSSDPRSGTLDSFLRLVERLHPGVVLIENVPGFLRGPTSQLAKIEAFFTELDRRLPSRYEVQHRFIDASSYGVPQRRNRAVLIAQRIGGPFIWPDATTPQPVTAWDALAEIAHPPGHAVTGKWAGLLPSIPEGWNYLWHTDRGGGLNLFGYRTRYWSFLLKLDKTSPSWTISAQPGPATGPFHWTNRQLSLSEILKLQSFPDDWYVAGARRHQIVQVGNATPPLLAEVIGRAVGSQYFGLEYTQPPRYAITRRTDLPAPESTCAVPARYLSLAGPHERHPGTGKGPKPRMGT